MQVHLCADIEMITNDSCFVRNIRRIHTIETPLLPELKLVKNNGKWVHSEGGRESNISKVIGESIARHQMQALKERDQKKE